MARAAKSPESRLQELLQRAIGIAQYDLIGALNRALSAPQPLVAAPAYMDAVEDALVRLLECVESYRSEFQQPN